MSALPIIRVHFCSTVTKKEERANYLSYVFCLIHEFRWRMKLYFFWRLPSPGKRIYHTWWYSTTPKFFPPCLPNKMGGWRGMVLRSKCIWKKKDCNNCTKFQFYTEKVFGDIPSFVILQHFCKMIQRQLFYFNLFWLQAGCRSSKENVPQRQKCDTWDLFFLCRVQYAPGQTIAFFCERRTTLCLTILHS